MSETIERIYGQLPVTHSIIWLHGLGASADDFLPIIPYLGLSASTGIRFIFPQAPDRAITVNSGIVMPGWYDIKGSKIEDKEDLVGISQSQATVELLIKEQVDKGVPSENIILAGFSQGGAVVYYTGIRLEQKIAGVLALSTYLPFASLAAAQHNGINRQIPIMAMHGVNDRIVPLELGKKSVEVLRALGYSLEWREYPMAHEVIMEQLADIGAWINRVFDR
jgi:phospholipase/carboxylesterase